MKNININKIYWIEDGVSTTPSSTSSKNWKKKEKNGKWKW